MSDEHEVLTLAETAAVLRVSQSAAYKAVGRGEIPSIRVGDRVLVPRVQLDALLRGGKVIG